MNLSIFVFYSPDRKDQLDQMVRLNSRMTGWEEADKILLVDGEANADPPGFRVIPVSRGTRGFNWARMWDDGVGEARHDNLLYLDSDRVLPEDYLSVVMDALGDNRFLFSDSLFGLQRPAPDELLLSLIRDYPPDRLRTEIDVLNQEWHERTGGEPGGAPLIYYDPRYRLPIHGPGKGPMSGNVAFTREGYRRSGGIDPWYCGHGAYADTDFHKQVWEAGFEVVPLDATEVHLWHPKTGEEGSNLTFRDIEVLSLNNFIYHARKWDLGYTYPRAIARYLGLDEDFVPRVLLRIESAEDFTPVLA